MDNWLNANCRSQVLMLLATTRHALADKGLSLSGIHLQHSANNPNYRITTVALISLLLALSKLQLRMSSCMASNARQRSERRAKVGHLA